MSAAAAIAAGGCGQDENASPTAPAPPDALTVTIDDPGGEDFRIELACAVADRAACAGVVGAIGEAGAGEDCEPLPPDPARIVVRGTIEGEPVAAAVPRRTTCEARAYDRLVAALGL